MYAEWVKMGAEFFRQNRESSCSYVDKTAFIEEFLYRNDTGITLITRPRRFGKTLMMTMLRDFFDIRQDSRSLFEGLAIAKNKALCDKWMNQYPVVFPTFKDVDGLTFAAALNRIAWCISDVCIENDFLLDSPAVDPADREKLQILASMEGGGKALLSDSLKILCRALHAHWGKPAILLIDEYDVPLARAQEKGYYPEMAGFIRSLFGAAFKDNEFLQAAILTGCLKLAKESVFAGLDSFQSYGVADARFADKYGFTSEEVDALLAAAGCPERKDAIQEWYDGYCFGDDAKVYCPWDILQYAADLITSPKAKPKPYWTDTSGNAAVYSFVRRTDFNVQDKIEKLLAGEAVPCRLAGELSYDALQSSEESFWTLLFMTGYLTKASSRQMEKCGIHPDKVPGDSAVLAIPNKEVLEVFADAASLWFKEAMDRADRTELFAAFWADDADGLTRFLCGQLKDTISFFDASENYYQREFFKKRCGVRSTRLLIPNVSYS